MLGLFWDECAHARVCVIGYGPVGEGFARRVRALGARVTIVDTNPTVALQALFAGFDVHTSEEALPLCDMNDDPASGEGFEAALIYKLAEKMGFSDDDVTWVRTTFDEAYAPGEHDWDLNIQQVSINEDREKAVDFSPAYFRPTQAVVLRKDNTYASAKACSDLANATIAVMRTSVEPQRTTAVGSNEQGCSLRPFFSATWM